jgi:hypothetical protein
VSNVCSGITIEWVTGTETRPRWMLIERKPSSFSIRLKMNIPLCGTRQPTRLETAR